ncbi:MAG: glycosyltransferase family 2 protein [Geminicoccaceae bacterium]
MNEEAIAEREVRVPVRRRSCAAKPTLCMINYNGERFLRDSLRSVQAEEFAEILLIDNGSRDESIEIVRREFPSVRIIVLPDNRGAAAARNAALREARTGLVLLVDNDVSLAPGCVALLEEALAEHPHALIAAPAVLYAHKRSLIQYDGADNHFIGLMTLHHENRPLSDANLETRQVGSVITACFLVDRSRLPDHEPFDESFFIYFEDHDFGVRMRALGHEILSVPAARCYHGEGTDGLSIRKLGEYSKNRVFYLIRNRWLFLFKNYALRSLALLSPALLLYELVQLVIVVKKGWIREWLRAIIWLLRHAPSALERRRRIQGARKNPDRVLLSGGPLPFRDELAAGRLERAGRRMLDAILGWYWNRVARLI